MKSRSTFRAVLALVVASAISAAAPTAAQEPADLQAIEQIKAEGFERSQVMELMSWLTDVYGPRLTGSSLSKKAGDWAIGQLQAWGVTGVEYEWWGPFGRGWVNERTVAQVTSPVPFPVIAYSPAWADGTEGPVQAEVVLVPPSVQTAADFAPYRGKLRGKIVVNAEPRELGALFEAPAHRMTEDELNASANPYPLPRTGGGFAGRRGPEPPPAGGSPPIDITQCFLDEGVAVVLRPGGGNSNGGNVFVSGGGSREADAPAGDAGPHAGARSTTAGSTAYSRRGSRSRWRSTFATASRPKS